MFQMLPLQAFEILWRRIDEVGGNQNMHWIAPSEKDVATDTLERRLWDSAD